MATELECPVCGERFSASGFPTHVRSHNKDPIVDGLIEVVSDAARTEPDTLTDYDPWQIMKTRNERMNRIRTERNQRVKNHLDALDQQIKRTLE
jgi:hypothetical protein